MKKAIHLIFFLTTLNVYSQESNIEILQNTITNLNNIDSVFYTSRFEGNESEVTYIHSEDSIFFLFDNFNKSSTPKYRIKFSSFLPPKTRFYNLTKKITFFPEKDRFQ